MSENVLLVEMDMKSEWYEWYKGKTTPWFTCDPHPGRDWVISQFEGMDCHERVKAIYALDKILQSRKYLINALHKATFRDFELEMLTPTRNRK
jgi:hypothetical protein